MALIQKFQKKLELPTSLRNINFVYDLLRFKFSVRPQRHVEIAKECAEAFNPNGQNKLDQDYFHQPYQKATATTPEVHAGGSIYYGYIRKRAYLKKIGLLNKSELTPEGNFFEQN